MAVPKKKRYRGIYCLPHLMRCVSLRLLSQRMLNFRPVNMPQISNLPLPIKSKLSPRLKLRSLYYSVSNIVNVSSLYTFQSFPHRLSVGDICDTKFYGLASSTCLWVARRIDQPHVSSHPVVCSDSVGAERPWGGLVNFMGVYSQYRHYKSFIVTGDGRFNFAQLVQDVRSFLRLRMWYYWTLRELTGDGW